MKLHYAAVCSLLLGLVQSSLTLEDTILDLSPRPEGIAIKERVLDSAERRDISAQLVVLRGVGMWDLPAFQVAAYCTGLGLVTGVLSLVKQVNAHRWLLVRAAAVVIPIGLLVVGLSALIWTKIDVGQLRSKIRRLEEMQTPVAVDLLKKEACENMHSLALTTEGPAEAFYGQKRWSQMLQSFAPHFELAQDAAHQKVLTNLTTRPVHAWPRLADLPTEIVDATAEDQIRFNQEIHNWTRNNFFTIPQMKNAIEAEYDHMHFNHTMELINLDSAHPYVNDSVAFKHLALTLLYQSSVSDHCLHGLNEKQPVREKWQTLRQNRGGRQARFGLALSTFYDARAELTKELYL